MAYDLAALLAERRRRVLEEQARARRQASRAYDIQAGGGSSLGAFQQAGEDRRRSYLVTALKKGNLAISQLSPRDAEIVGVNRLQQMQEKTEAAPTTPLASQAEDEGGDNNFFDVIGNLGTDIVEMGKGLPQGLYNTGKAVVEDVARDPLDMLGDVAETAVLPFSAAARAVQGEDPLAAPKNVYENFESTEEDILKPVAESYKYTYGPLFEGDTGEFAHRVAEHPLGPLLDVSAVLTGGAGLTARAGRIASELGAGSRLGGALESERLAGLGRRMEAVGDRTRDPIEISPGVEINRRYSRGPIMRYGIQKPYDALARKFDPIGEFARKYNINRQVSKSFAKFRQREGWKPDESVAPVVERFDVLDNDEYMAWLFGAQGLNFQRLPGFGGTTMLDEYQGFLQRSLENANPEGQNIKDFEAVGVPRETVELQLKAINNPAVRQHILKPTENMQAAHEAYRTYLDEQSMQGPVTPEEIELRRFAPSQAMRREAIKDPSASFSAYAKKAEAETGVRPLEPTYVPHTAARGEVKRGTFQPSKPTASPRTVTNPLNKAKPFYYRDYDMSALKAGAWRTDRQGLIDHLQKRERDLLHNDFNEEFAYRWGLKDGEGEPILVKNNHDMRRELSKYGLDPKDFVLIAPGAAVRWFRAEFDHVDEIVKVLDEAPTNAEGKIIDSAQLRAQLDEVAEGDAQVFAKEYLSAANEPGYILPKNAVDQLKAHIEASENWAGAFDKAGFRAWRAILNKWRTLTLVYMPRWWINTVVGNSVLALMAGAWSVKGMRQARRLIGANKVPEGWRLGVRAGEQMEAGRIAGELSSSRVTRKLYHVNQQIEDHIRVMSGIHLLDNEVKDHLRGAGNVLEDYGRRGLTDDDIDYIIENHPELVDAATDEMNKFFYNYMELGPFERRFLRDVVPFWGWYKFATKLSWRLPVEYPGRALILENLSQVARETNEEEFGLLSPELMGAIILNRDPKNLKFLPALGWNPMGEFATPFDEAQGIGGLLGLNQMAPPIQAFLAGFGVNTFGGGASSMAPGQGRGVDFLGRVASTETGMPSMASGGDWFNRVAGTLGRSIPQVALLERSLPTPLGAGGRPVFPESVPFVNTQPIPVSDESIRGTSLGDILLQTTPFAVRTTNLIEDQKMAEDVRKYLRARERNELKDIMAIP